MRSYQHPSNTHLPEAMATASFGEEAVVGPISPSCLWRPAYSAALATGLNRMSNVDPLKRSYAVAPMPDGSGVTTFIASIPRGAILTTKTAMAPIERSTSPWAFSGPRWNWTKAFPPSSHKSAGNTDSNLPWIRRY